MLESESAQTDKQQGMEVRDKIAFIRKVYGILSAQLAFTVAVVLMVMNAEKQSFEFMVNPFFMIALLTTYIATTCALYCCNLHR